MKKTPPVLSSEVEKTKSKLRIVPVPVLTAEQDCKNIVGLFS